MENNTIDLEELHAAIKYFFAQNFTWAQTIEAYTRQDKTIATPAIFYELDEITPDNPDDIGTEQWACQLRFAAYVVLDYKNEGNKTAKILAKVKALQIAAKLNKNRFDENVGEAKIIGIAADEFSFDTERYECQRLEWAHSALVGEDVWAEEPLDPKPDHGFFGTVPNIGPEHESDYIDIPAEP